MSALNDMKTSSSGEIPTQKAYTIGGVPIMFPYKAYPSQITMMDKIIKCLNKKHNCLLESPTGSGKSLALLCSTLAWLRKTEKEIKQMEQLLDKRLNAHGVIVADVPSYEENIAVVSDFEKHKFKHQNYHDANVADHVPSYEENCAVVSDFEKHKFKHQNSYDVNVADHVPSSEKNCEATSGLGKYKFRQKTKETSGIKVESPAESTSDEKIESKFFCSATCSSSCNPNVDFKISGIGNDSPSIQSKGKYFSKEETLKKRGIIYIDDDSDDFQPLKKNKIFSAHQSDKLPNSLKENISASNFNTYKQNINETSVPPKCTEYGNCDSDNVASTKKVPDTDNYGNLPPKLPKIYFGTRTHKQIGQIIRELKKTPYKDVKMTILSSRERTCIHPKNSKARNKNDGCDELIRDNGPGCKYYKNIRRVCYYHPPEMSTAFDLEDFVSICRRKQICPYFGARELLQTSEIVFCPYNYLVDPLIRSALSISLKGNIVIMDEAHNIEDSAREAANRSISVSQMKEAIADVLQIGQRKRDDSEPYMHIAKVLENLKKWLESSHELKDYVSFDSSAKVWSGGDMIAVLDYVGLGPDTFPVFLSKYKIILADENETEKAKTEVSDDLKLSGLTHMCLKGLTETLNYMYKENMHFVPDFRCVVKNSKSQSSETSVIPFSQASKRNSFASVFELSINFWCMNPAVVFSDMKDVIHSLIVASGTLAPLASFQSELGLPFQITLEANHVISKDQMWIGTIGRGPSNNCLNGTFHHASTYTYQDDVGNLVLEICSIIPHGVLCFLPSYSMLDRLASRWKLTGLWDKLQCKKVVCCEPRGANADFQLIMEEFYEAVKDSEEDNTYNDDVKGAVFFAVCRGKVSEGLDFADNNARAVITIGIPFPHVKEPQVDLKKKYNDIYSSKRPIVTGSEWYEMQAFRALNQALGRCIRHRDDFGALIIVDERFQKMNRYVGALSKWIRKDIEHFPTFYDAINSLCRFAEKMGLKDSKED